MGDEKMRYTRYDLKQKQGSNKFFGIILIIIIVAAIFIGTAMSKLLLKSNQYLEDTNSVSKASSSSDVTKPNEYVFLQCGIFSKKENADVLMSTLSKFGNPVEINDGNKIRVIFGFYKKDDYYKKATKSLNDNKIDVHEIDYKIYDEDDTNNEIAKIIDGDIQIINKLGDSNVKGIQTTDFKKWSSKLEKGDKSDRNSAELIKLKDYVGKLPETFTKDNIVDNIQFVYDELKKINAVTSKK